MYRLLTMLLIAVIGPVSPGFAQERPKLVLQITIDQLRGDLIDRFGSGLGDQGFNYLRRNGVVFADAHHRHANTETIVGHTTLATGTDPAVHGMVANLWFDRIEGEQFYNVQDPDFPLIGGAGVDTRSYIDCFSYVRIIICKSYIG